MSRWQREHTTNDGAQVKIGAYAYYSQVFGCEATTGEQMNLKDRFLGLFKKPKKEEVGKIELTPVVPIIKKVPPQVKPKVEGFTNGALVIPIQTQLIGNPRTFAKEQLAKMKSYGEIIKELGEKFKITTTESELIRLEKKSTREIQSIRTKYLLDLSAVPIANEVIRLERTEEFFKLSQGLNKDTSKIDYGLKCLKEARQEIKGEGEGLTANIQVNQFTGMSDEELIQKKKKMDSKIMELIKREDGTYAQP